MTDFNYGMTEGTTMLVEELAASEKLKPKEDRWYPTHNNHDDDIDEKFDTYVTAGAPAAAATYADNEYAKTNNDDNNYNTHHSDNNANASDKNPKSDTNKFIDEEYEKLSPLEKRLRRLDIMRALGELRDLGCKVTNYNIDDDYYMMKYELDLHRSIRSKRNWLGLYSHLFIGVVKGVELVNNSYNPFDFSLTGLSDEVKADKNTYYEILGEIYEHHNVPGKKMNPWFRLMVTLIGVVVTVGGKNNAHKFIPNRAQKVEDDEDYIEKLRAKAAQDTQSQMARKQNMQNQQFQNQQTQQNQNNLDEYMNRQHENAAQRAKDLEELKRQELQYQKYTQMLGEQKDKFNQMKKSLELTASAQSPQSPQSMHSNKSSVRSNPNQKQQVLSQLQNKSRSRSVTPKQEQDTMSDMSTTSKNTQKSSASNLSQISINKNLAKKFNKLNTNKRSNSTEIKADQISFGSNRKK
jgi:hypothetical protein